jgi:hypothetical protein
MHLHYPGVVPRIWSDHASDAASWGGYALATYINYENAQGVVWNDLLICFLVTPTEFVFFIYLIVDLDFTETFPIGGQHGYGAHKIGHPQECKKDCYSSNIKHLDCRIKWVLEEVCRAEVGGVLRQFSFLPYRRAIRDGKTFWFSFFFLFWSITKCVQVTIPWLEDRPKTY